MDDRTFGRRKFATLALGAIGSSIAAPAFAKGSLRVRIPSSTSSTSSTSKISTTTTKTTTTTTPTSTPTATTAEYCAVSVDSGGRCSFANQVWNLHRDTRKEYAAMEVAGLTPRRHRFEVRSGDSWKGEVGRNRSEFSCATRHEYNRDVWFSYAMRIRGGAPVTNWNVIGQFHHTPDAADPGGVSPPFSINLLPGEKLRLIRRFDGDATTKSLPKPVIMHERTVVRDRWYRIVGRVVFGWQNNGAVDLWIDGVKVVSLANTSIGYNDLKGPYWKFGIYRAQAAETLVVDYANLELGPASLLSRVTGPLPI